jgi:ribonuclease P protein component
MLPKKNRANKKEFDLIFKNGKFVSSPNITLKYIKNIENVGFSSFKIAFVVPKTVSKKAVDRNLLKRRGFNTLKDILKNKPLKIGAVFVFGKKSMEFFGGKKTKESNPKEKLKEELVFLINKIN